MIVANYKIITHLALAVSIILILQVVTWPSSPAQAALPPRPGPTPLPQRHDSDDSNEKPIGVYIELRVQAAPAELWTVVQWQDASGVWHNVEGWQGTLDQDYRKVWWVARANFGTGPFRWIAYQPQVDRLLLAASQSFYLPRSAGESVKVELSFAP